MFQIIQCMQKEGAKDAPIEKMLEHRKGGIFRKLVVGIVLRYSCDIGTCSLLTYRAKAKRLHTLVSFRITSRSALKQGKREMRFLPRLLMLLLWSTIQCPENFQYILYKTDKRHFLSATVALRSM